MKKRNINIEHEIDQILQSGSRKENVSTSPFFTTRVIGRVEQLEVDTVWFPKLSLFLRPVLVLLVIVNLINYYVYDHASSIESSSVSNLELAVNDYAAWNSDFILTDDVVFDN